MMLEDVDVDVDGVSGSELELEGPAEASAASDCTEVLRFLSPEKEPEPAESALTAAGLLVGTVTKRSLEGDCCTIAGGVKNAEHIVVAVLDAPWNDVARRREHNMRQVVRTNGGSCVLCDRSRFRQPSSASFIIVVTNDAWTWIRTERLQ